MSRGRREVSAKPSSYRNALNLIRVDAVGRRTSASTSRGTNLNANAHYFSFSYNFQAFTRCWQYIIDVGAATLTKSGFVSVQYGIMARYSHAEKYGSNTVCAGVASGFSDAP